MVELVARYLAYSEWPPRVWLANRLWLAVSLCALRFMGFVPDDIASVPDEALAFVAGQIDAAAH